MAFFGFWLVFGRVVFVAEVDHSNVVIAVVVVECIGPWSICLVREINFPQADWLNNQSSNAIRVVGNPFGFEEKSDGHR